MKAVKITLSNKHIKTIQRILKENCKGEDCITRLKVFERLKLEEPLEIEPYKFSQLLTNAIRTGKIIGFETKVGRNGGIRKSIRPKTVRDNLKEKMGNFAKSGLNPDDDKVVDYVTKLVEQ
jgi:hypothetical protein